MKLILTKDDSAFKEVEELVASAIQYLKSENIINPEKTYVGKVSEYSSDKYFVVEELQPKVSEVKDEEKTD